MMKNETWLADSIEQFVRDAATAGLTDYFNPVPNVEFDQLEAMVDDMFIYENARITEAIERSYTPTLSYDDVQDSYEFDEPEGFDAQDL